MAVPPDFVAGQVLTAAQMNKVGRWLVKTQTIGTAVSSTAVTGAFSADYDQYEIIITGGVVSVAGTSSLMTLGSTATGYYWFNYQGNYANTVASSGGVNSTSWFVGLGGTSLGFATRILVGQPFLADESWYECSYRLATTTGAAGWSGGYLNNTTSYTDFTITYSGGTATGGTIYVYGLRD